MLSSKNLIDEYLYNTDFDNYPSDELDKLKDSKFKIGNHIFESVYRGNRFFLSKSSKTFELEIDNEIELVDIWIQYLTPYGSFSGSLEARINKAGSNESGDGIIYSSDVMYKFEIYKPLEMITKLREPLIDNTLRRIGWKKITNRPRVYPLNIK